MYYCKKCGKEVASKNDLYRSICNDCCKKLIYERMEHFDDPDYEMEFPPEEETEHPFLDFLKKIFQGKKK